MAVPPPTGTRSTFPPPQLSPWRPVRTRDHAIAGVCRGLAVAAGIDVTLVRLAFIAAALSGFGLLAYAALWIVMPAEDPLAGRMATAAPPETAKWLKVGLLVGGLVGLTSLAWRWSFGLFVPFPFHDGFHAGPGLFFGLTLLVGGVAVVWLHRRDDTPLPSGPLPPPPVAGGFAPPAEGTAGSGPALVDPGVVGARPGAVTPTASAAPPPGRPGGPLAPPPVPPRRPPLTAGVIVARVFAWLAVIVTVLAAIAVSALAWTGALSLTFPVLVGLVCLAALVGVIVAAATSRQAWVVLVALGVLVAAAGLTLGLAEWNGSIGQRIVRPANRAAVEPHYEQAIGRFVLDLSSTPLGESEVPVAIDQGIGRLDVVVPSNAVVDARVHVKAGESRLLGRVSDGVDVDQQAVDEGFQPASRLRLDLGMGIGQVVVCRAGTAARVGTGCDAGAN